MNRFGEHLRAARTRANLSQKKLGKLVEVDDSYISKMETGTFPPPSRDVALKLADALGMNDKADRLAFLLAARAASEEDVQGLKLVDQATHKAASPGTVLRSPLSPSDQEILMRRLAMMEKRLKRAEKMSEAIAKHLQEARAEYRELAAFAGKMFRKE